MFTKKTMLHLLAVIALIAVGYFWSGAIQQHWDMLRTHHYTWHLPSLVAAFLLTLSAFLTDTLIFHVCMNRHVHQNLLSLPMGFTLFNTSNILKYLPGTVWSYTAQLVWFSQRGVSLPRVVYVNVVCSMTAILTSLLVGAVCSLYYYSLLGRKSVVFLLVVVLIDLVFICSGSRCMVLLVRYLNRYLHKDMQVLPISPAFLVVLHLIYAGQWVLLGLGGSFAVNGIGLAHDWSHLCAIVFSLAVSWVIGYVSLLTPGGLGVREGVMYAILQHVTDVQTSLMLPIAMRFLYLLVDCCLGLAGSLCAIKWRIFAPPTTVLAPEATLDVRGA